MDLGENRRWVPLLGHRFCTRCLSWWNPFHGGDNNPMILALFLALTIEKFQIVHRTFDRRLFSKCMLSWGIYDGKNQNHSLNRRYTAVFSVVTQRASPLTPHLFTIKTPPTLLQKNKNQEQRRKFHIALLTKKVSTPISEGVYGIFVRTYLLNSSNSFTKDQASSRRGSKCTLRNWLRSV